MTDLRAATPQMKLFQIVLEGREPMFLMARTSHRASFAFIVHELNAGRTKPNFTVERIDNKLPDERRLGLDDILALGSPGKAEWDPLCGWSVSMTSMTSATEVFEFGLSWSEELVTVFAVDVGDAERIYIDWIQAHHPDKPARASVIYHYAGVELEGRPELMRACSSGKAGVGHWVGTPGRWLIAGPDEPPAGDLVRPASAVKYHRVTATDGDELIVFAESFEEAVGYYVIWHLEAYGDVPQGIVINRKSRWQLVLALASLRDEMDAGEVGVARCTAEDGWHIVDPEDGTVLSDHML